MYRTPRDVHVAYELCSRDRESAFVEHEIIVRDHSAVTLNMIAGRAACGSVYRAITKQVHAIMICKSRSQNHKSSYCPLWSDINVSRFFLPLYPVRFSRCFRTFKREGKSLLTFALLLCFEIRRRHVHVSNKSSVVCMSRRGVINEYPDFSYINLFIQYYSKHTLSPFHLGEAKPSSIPHFETFPLNTKDNALKNLVRVFIDVINCLKTINLFVVNFNLGNKKKIDFCCGPFHDF